MDSLFFLLCLDIDPSTLSKHPPSYLLMCISVEWNMLFYTCCTPASFPNSFWSKVPIKLPLKRNQATANHSMSYLLRYISITPTSIGWLISFLFYSIPPFRVWCMDVHSRILILSDFWNLTKWITLVGSQEPITPEFHWQDILLTLYADPAHPKVKSTGKEVLVSYEKMSKSKYNGVDPVVSLVERSPFVNLTNVPGFRLI